MTMYVFVGPTVLLEDAQKTLDATYLPPAAQGDVHCVALERPYAIGIVDGYFQRMPSVWHKEILWAMAQGIRVYGSASMGALRAAELAPFGMVGVGWVFEAFHSGVLEDDDEVAIAHAADEHDYRPASEAMVNIRCTLNRAAQERIIGERTAELLTRIAKALYYPERSYPRLLADGEAHGLDARDLRSLCDWLPSGAVNQKRNDALAMLRLMKSHAEECRPPLEVRYSFEHTAAWEAARISSRQGRSGAAKPAYDCSDHDVAVIDELKLSGTFGRACRAATTRALALELARQVDRRMEGAVLHEAIVEFRRERGLEQDEAFERWLEAQEIASLDFFKDEALVQMVSRMYEQQALRLLPDQLRATGEYGRLLDRARSKERALTSLGSGHLPRELDDAELVAWYFQRHLRRRVPEDLSLYLHELGVASLADFVSTLTREYHYACSLEGKSSPEGK